MAPIKRSYKGERFTQEKAQAAVDILTPLITCDKLFFGGSYCREKASCGDLDVAVLSNNGTYQSIIEIIKQFKGDTLVAFGPGAALTRLVLDIEDIPLKFQIDFWFITNVGQWGPLCMFVAGDKTQNIQQRIAIMKQGYSLSQYGVFRNNESCGDFPTEQSVYKYLGWLWVPYKDRNKNPPGE